MSHVVTSSGSLGLARGLWGGTGAWLGVIICLIALLCQSIHLGNLQVELSLMQKTQGDSRTEGKKQHNEKEGSLTLCRREKRDLLRDRKPRHTGRRSFLHLVPESFSSDESQDLTVISWKVALMEGKSLDVQGVSVTVKNSGIYYIYSQVLYNDSIFTMGHLVIRKVEGDVGSREVLLRCVQSMPLTQDKAYNTCYSAGVFRLQKGDSISLIIPRLDANVDTSGQATFLGLVRL